ncbi:MAG: tyrosine recombinase [Acidimicrobiia bacterium]
MTDHTAEFVASIVAERGLAANTAKAYQRDLAQFFAFVDGDAGTTTEDSIRTYLEELRSLDLAEASVARKFAAIRAYQRFLVIEGLREDDPTAGIDAPQRSRTLPKALTIEEVLALLDSVDTSTAVGLRDKAVLEFLYATGCRVSELCGLGQHDYDAETRTAMVTGKGQRERLVPVGSYAAESIDDWLPVRLVWRLQGADPGTLFLSTRGNELSRQAVWRLVKKHGASARIEPSRLSPHVLRHSAATHMVEGGADLRSVQEILGHASLSTTQTYTKVSPEHLYEVVMTSHPRGT